MKEIKALDGKEKISCEQSGFLTHLSAFWQWSYSSLNSPIIRGDFAEFLVYKALEGEKVSSEYYGTRMDWDIVDLTYGEGIPDTDNKPFFCSTTKYGWGIEVKSSSEKNKSGVRFNVAPKNGFHPNFNKSIDYKRNWSDIYIFALLKDESAQTSVADMTNWLFYILPTCKLDELRRSKNIKIKSVTLNDLKNMNAVKCKFNQLKVFTDQTIELNQDKLVDWKLSSDSLKKLHIRP